MQQDDWTLVGLAQRGNVQAFGELYERYFDRIYRYVAFRVSGQAAVEDLTEQVFLRALEALDSLRWRGVPFVAWLFRIARNQVIDYHRAQARQLTVPLDDTLRLDDLNPDPASTYECKLKCEELRQAIAKLTDAQRQVIALKFAAGLSNAEVAKVLQKTEGAVKALQHSALESLRRKLAKLVVR